MRKAVAQVTKGRRNKQEKSPDKPQPPPPPPPPAVRNHVKMTPDEAALTAKNYRLAKELSELRVRHREECKTVTKLTMENMNLASRCREALSHVAMLKKELAICQRRIAESALTSQQESQSSTPPPSKAPSSRALIVEREQREQLNRGLAPQINHVITKESSAGMRSRNSIMSMSEEKSDTNDDLNEAPKLVSSDDFEEDDISSTLGPAHSSPTPSPAKHINGVSMEATSNAPKVATSTTVRALLKPPSGSPIRENHVSNPVDLDDSEFDENANSPSSPVVVGKSDESVGGRKFFPHSASPKLGRGGHYNEEFPGDITADAVRHQHQQYHPSRLGGFQESNENEEESSVHSTSSSGQQPLATQNCAKQKEGPLERVSASLLSSIDAFEASFQQDFPDSFSPREEKKPGEEVYDPFSSSPQRHNRISSNTQQDSPDTSLTKPSSPSHGSPSSRGTSIRERAAAAYRRPAGNRWTGPSDPPGKDRTSTRKSGPLGDQAKTVRTFNPVSVTPTPSYHASIADQNSALLPGESKSEANSGLTNGKIDASQPSKSATTSISVPTATPTKTPRGLVVDGSKKEVFQTPSPLSLTSSESLTSEPARPEKAGYDAARARYEKALMPKTVMVRENSGEIPLEKKQDDFIDHKNDMPQVSQQLQHPSNPDSSFTSDSSSTSDRPNRILARISAYQESISPKHQSPGNRSFWPPVTITSDSNLPSDEEDSVIKHTSYIARPDAPSVVSQSPDNGAEPRSRQRPWETTAVWSPARGPPHYVHSRGIDDASPEPPYIRKVHSSSPPDLISRPRSVEELRFLDDLGSRMRHEGTAATAAASWE